MKTILFRIMSVAALAVLTGVLVAGCGGGTIPTGSNSASVSGSQGTASGGIPVKCDSAVGNVHIQAGSFSGTKTVSITCVSSGQAQELNSLVKAKTGSSNQVLGAITLEPSPFTFNKLVTLVIPLLTQRADLAGSYRDIYVYAPDVSGDLRKVSQALVADDGWTATGTVARFSTFILVGPPEGGAAPEEPQPPEPAIGFTRTLLIQEDGNFRPDLFRSWMIPDDGESITFELEQDLTLADGTPLTVYAVVDAIQKQDYSLFDDVYYEYVDDYTIIFFAYVPPDSPGYFDLLTRLSRISFDVR